MTEKKQWQERVNRALDDSVEQLDELTTAKIKAARIKALERVNQVPWWRKITLGQGAFATAFSLVLAALLIIPLKSNQDNDDLALMAAMNPVLAEAPEMLSDLEFLAWLEQEQLLEESSEFGT